MDLSNRQYYDGLKNGTIPVNTKNGTKYVSEHEDGRLKLVDQPQNMAKTCTCDTNPNQPCPMHGGNKQSNGIFSKTRNKFNELNNQWQAIDLSKQECTYPQIAKEYGNIYSNTKFKPTLSTGNAVADYAIGKIPYAGSLVKGYNNLEKVGANVARAQAAVNENCNDGEFSTLIKNTFKNIY